MSDPETYDEPARSYASLLIFAGVIVLGFVIDLILGGGMAHLLGWVIALVLVVGLNFIVVYAVRSEKSLHVTVDELRVGDEALVRAEIVAVAAGIDEAELPVLGWPTGKPRSLTGLTVRLEDGRDVVIPTRSPDRLRAALGLATADVPARSQDVRAAGRADLPTLPDIDLRAGAVFRAAGLALPAHPFPEDRLRAAKAVFVAGRPAVGFVWVDEVDGLAHVQELAVIPKWMGQGIGGRLLERACEWAAGHGYRAVTLITYAEVAWNAPFYARRGFVQTDDVTPGLATLRGREQELGLDQLGRRVVMKRDLPA